MSLPSPRNRFNRDVPTLHQLKEALSIVSAALDGMNVKYGLIGQAAVMLYANLYKPPIVHRSTGNIDIIIQPVGDVDGREVTERLCSEEFAGIFKTKYGKGNGRRGVGFGPKTPQVILTPNDGFVVVPSASDTKLRPGSQTELLIDVNIKDHWEYYQRRPHYNLAERQNNRLQVTLDQAGKKINVLTPAWLLRQKIYQCVDRADDVMVDTRVKRKEDWKDIDTLTSILVKRKEKCYMTSAEEKDVLRKFVVQIRVDLGEEFTSVVWSPEVMGDWGNVLWVQILMMLVGFVVLGLLKEQFWDE